MEPNISQSTHESLSGVLQRKRFLLLWVVGGLMVLSISAAVLTSTGQQPETTPVPAPEATKKPDTTPPPTSTPDPQQQRTDAIVVVNTVLAATRRGDLQSATHYFQYGADSWQTEEGVLHTLRMDKARFTDAGTYDAQVLSDSVEISGKNAQVPVTHTVAGKQTTSRYDLVQTPAGWRIATISYDKAPDLITVTKLREDYLSTVEQPAYSESPASLTLPAGDVVDVNKTLFTSLRTQTGAHQDIEIAVRSAKRNYSLALYDGAHIVDSAIILTNQPGTHFQSFDIRPLLDLYIGSLLFYPEETIFDRTKPGKPEGLIYEIPIKLDLKQ